MSHILALIQGVGGGNNTVKPHAPEGILDRVCNGLQWCSHATYIPEFPCMHGISLGVRLQIAG